jgi:hypothetical protein
LNGDVDAAADYVIHNVLPYVVPDDNDASMNEDILGKVFDHVHDLALDK